MIHAPIPLPLQFLMVKVQNDLISCATMCDIVLSTQEKRYISCTWHIIKLSPLITDTPWAQQCALAQPSPLLTCACSAKYSCSGWHLQSELRTKPFGRIRKMHSGTRSELPQVCTRKMPKQLSHVACEHTQAVGFTVLETYVLTLHNNIRYIYNLHNYIRWDSVHQDQPMHHHAATVFGLCKQDTWAVTAWNLQRRLLPLASTAVRYHSENCP